MELQLMRLRKQAGYRSRDDFAAALGVNKHTYRSWETGAAMMSLEQAYHVTEVLGCTLDELVGRKPGIRFSDPKQQMLNHCYSMLDERSKSELAGFASTMTADRSRLASKSGEIGPNLGLGDVG